MKSTLANFHGFWCGCGTLWLGLKLRILLFGSYARGQQTQDSDLDLLVTFSKGKSLIDHIRTEKAFESLLGKKVDLVIERSLSPYIAPMIKKDVKRLYYEK